MHQHYWKVHLSTDEQDGRTTATARLHWAERTVVGHGVARCNPSDRDVADIGAELAAARALSDLAGRLLDVTRHHIEATTNAPVHGLR